MFIMYVVMKLCQQQTNIYKCVYISHCFVYLVDCLYFVYLLVLLSTANIIILSIIHCENYYIENKLKSTS